jgi:hypothetical protein
MARVWIHAGPRAGRYDLLSDEDAARAEGEGWAQIVLKTTNFKSLKRADKTTPHDKAAAFLAERSAKQMSPAAPVAGGYVTRESRTLRGDNPGGAADSLLPTAPPAVDPAVPPDDQPEPERRRPGRPRKSSI